MTDRALVLGGGGIAGVAWELGMLAGLIEAGVDVADPDLVVGTSAGSVVGALLRSGRDPEELYRTQLVPVPDDEPVVELDGLDLVGALAAAIAGPGGEQAARARLGELARAADTVPEADRRAVLADRIGDPPWPTRRLVVTAVDTADGAFVPFDAASGVRLLDAVTASCAVPGVWPPITVGGRRCMDGGVRSVTNADLAAGCARVLVLAPLPGLGGGLGPTVDGELALLRRDGAARLVLADAASRAAFGPNLLDPRSRAPAARAGRVQAAAVATAVGEFWA